MTIFTENNNNNGNESITKFQTPESWISSVKKGKHAEGSWLIWCVQKVALAALAMVALLFLPITLMYRAFFELKEFVVLSFNLNPTLTAVRDMKKREEEIKFEAMQQVVQKFTGEQTPEEMKQKLMRSVSDLQKESENLCRHFLSKTIRELSRHSNFKHEWIPYIIQGPLSDPKTWEDTGENLAQKLNNNLPNGTPPDLVEAINKCLLKGNNSSDFRAELKNKVIGKRVKNPLEPQKLAEFNELLNALLTIIKDKDKLKESDPAKANRQFIECYRKLLQHPVYKWVKYDSSLPCVELLHKFAVATWNNVHALDLYKNVGKAIIQDGGLAPEEGEIPSTDLAQKFSDSQKTVAQNLYDNDGLFSKLHYTVMHFWQSMGALASEGGSPRLLPALIGFGEYDSHGTLSNNPSLQGTSTWSAASRDGKKIRGTVNNCYGGSPTIGDHHISPEFIALNQAIENNLLALPDHRDPTIPHALRYYNLQNLDKMHGENARSRTLMHLNDRFPLTFLGTTLAKDAPLHHMKHKKDVIWENAEQMGKTMMEKLMKGVSSPDTQSGHGFYFFGDPVVWKEVFTTVIDTVNKSGLYDKNAATHGEKEKLQGAYQEHVYSLLIALKELEAIQALHKAGIENPLIMQMEVCKEDIDRGGAENAKYMYLRLPFAPNAENAQNDLFSKDHLEELIGGLNCRAISARDRAILKDRMRQLLAFVEVVSPAAFNNTLNSCLEKLGEEATFTFTTACKGPDSP